MQEVGKTLSLAALISMINPLELVKSRIQTMNELVAKGNLKNHYRGILDCLKSVKSQEGIRALWKGNSIGLLRFFPSQQINFSVKNQIQAILPTSIWANALSGIFGGWAAAGILYPIDTARIFISNSVETQRKASLQLKRIVQVEGAKFLYRGYGSCLASIALFRGCFFGLYDSFKVYSETTFGRWMTAYCSGLLAGITVYPIETIRKRKIMMDKKIGQWDLFRTIVRKEGFRALYRGCSLTPLQCLAGSAIVLYFDTQKN